MRTYARLLATLCGPAIVIVALLLLVTPTSVGEPLNAFPISGDKLTAPAAPLAGPVVFLHDPNWPVYAQTEITVFPDPPVAGQPTEICVWVLNTSAASQTVTVDLAFANFGIGLPFTLIGSRTITVPPGASAKVCLNWIPPDVGHWCLQAILHVPPFPDDRSQRNIDIWEKLLPGVPAVTEFPIMNPLSEAAPVHLELKRNPVRADWDMSLSPTDIPQLAPGQQLMATLIVTPPVGAKLGTRDYIADVEAAAMTVPTPTLIGGFRKLDWPPVPLHRMQDPPYAESEITIDPYPPLAGEPARICVELRNTSDEPQTVDVGFEVSSQLGIGLPFTPIDHQLITILPHDTIRVCTMWVPPAAGHFCVHIILHDPQNLYVDQHSQRNMDVNEVLLPGIDVPLVFPVQNPLPYPTVITMSAMHVDSFFDVFFDLPTTFPLNPGEVHMVTAHVIRLPGPVPDPGTVVADFEATYVDEQQQPHLLGGIRKEFHLPITLHQPGDPIYAEREITIDPYPPRAGEPTQICVELRNPTDMPQTVDVEFAIANFGIGLPFTPIQVMPVTLPPHSIVKKCVTWVPPFAGHFCVQISLIDPQFPGVIQRSQRNIDVGEVFEPGQWTQPFVFPVSNPSDQPTDIEVAAIPHLPDWQISLTPTLLLNVPPHAVQPVTLTVRPPIGVPFPEDDTPIVDVEAHAQGYLIGGFRKIYRPPVPIHQPGDPVYAESEISINPYPPREREPTEICVDVRNPTNVTQTITVTFAVANFGIGLPFHDIARPIAVTLPPNSIKRVCITWVPPFGGHFCAQVTLQMADHESVWSQRNMDVSEILLPGQPAPYAFLVGNPTTSVATVTLGLVPHLDGWAIELSQDVLPNLQPGDTRLVTLTVTPPVNAPMPLDGEPVVDVEAYIGGQLIGGFRKIYRPPIPIHPSGDPVYAESEIHINPYPPRERQPTEICTDVRNPTDVTQTFTITFAIANFGIGLPFHDIARPIAVTLPPHSIKTVCITWVPPFGGHFCAQITLVQPGHEPVWSQRNMDVAEIFIPGQPSTLAFPVGNPMTQPMTVTLGLVPHLEGWSIELSQDVLLNLAPNATRLVTLTVTPPLNQPFPPPESPVVDVEGYIGHELIGGFRKIFYPPIPVHPPKDPVYAESEIFIDPYPVQLGGPTTIGALVFNPTDFPQAVTVTFGVAHFGIGMPFTQTGILTPTMMVAIPPHGQARVQTQWIAQYQGHTCVQIEIQSAGHDPVYSQRNVDVGEPLNPNQPHTRIVEVRNSKTEVVTITMALINHRPNWQMSITPTLLTNVTPGEVRQVTLSVQPPSWDGLADEQPIADVEAYVNGELIGGIRKIAKPPVPLHKPQDRPYAESEISVQPYPLIASQPATITTEIMNNSDVTQTVRAEFWVANFGFGIPFTNTNLVPTYRDVTLDPWMSTTVSAVWTPPDAGHWCIQIRLLDPSGQYPDQISQRNVDVERRNFVPCQPFTKDFWLQNATALTVTVDLGANAINLPAGWTWSTNITQTVLNPYQGITVTLTITPPCGLATPSWLTPQGTLNTGGASGPATIDVEGYVDGELLGGVEMQLETVPPEWKIYLPIIRR